MFRMWCKIFTDNHLVKDTVIFNDNPDTSRTKKVLNGLAEACRQFDLSVPIWLDSTISDFKKHDKARFMPDSFIEDVNFDYMEIHVIEED